MQPLIGNMGTEEEALRERDRLVRLCAHLTGAPDYAEDLAHETLLVAMAHERMLRDPERRPQWLTGIARNICRRWAAARGRELARSAGDAADDVILSVAERTPAGVDLDTALERGELAALLDHALAILPSVTREVLVRRFVDELPHAEIAARLGMSEDAVSMRLSRGRLALRQVLHSAELRDEASGYGLCAPTAERWEETRLWCLLCGRRRLEGRFTAAEFMLRCLTCSTADLPYAHVRPTRWGPAVGQLKSYRPAYTRLMAWVDAYVVPALPARAVPCAACGRVMPLRLGPHGSASHYIDYSCLACGHAGGTSLNGLILTVPEGLRFWRAYPRLRKLPEREVETQGRPAIVTTFESVTAPARVDLVSARDTYETLGVHVSGLPRANTDV